MLALAVLYAIGVVVVIYWLMDQRLDWTEKLLASLITQNLNNSEGNIVEAISKFYEKVKALLESISRNTSSVIEDVTLLKQKIADFQNSPGTISNEDQAMLDEIESLAAALDSKVQQVDKLASETPEIEQGTDVAPPSPLKQEPVLSNTPGPEPTPEPDAPDGKPDPAPEGDGGTESTPAGEPDQPEKP